MPGIIGQWVCFQENSLPRHTIQKPWWKASDDHTYLKKRKTNKNMPLYILCAYFRHPKKQQPQTQNNPESNYGSTIAVWQAEEKPFIMPNNAHSGRSRNWQENSLTVAVGLGQWEERRGIITQLTHVWRASPVLGASVWAEASSPLLTPRWQLC